MRKKNRFIKYVIVVLFILIVYWKLHEKVQEPNEFQAIDAIDQLNQNQTFIKNIKLNFVFSNGYLKKIENFFDNFDQFKLYLRFKKNSNKQDTLSYLESKIILDKIKNSKIKKQFLIVEYTKIFGQTKYCYNKISDDLLSQMTDQELALKLKNEKTSDNNYDLLDKCHYKNCFFSCNKNLASQADALLFHETDFENDVKSIPKHENYEKLYPYIFDFKRDPSQFWIIWNDEANPLGKLIDNFRFNWTISYNSKSEISYCAYGCLTKLNWNKDDLSFKSLVLEQFNKRSKNVLWFVSNCNAKARLKVVEKIAKYYSVKIYGKCNEMIKKMYNDKKMIDFNDEPCLRDSKCEKDALNENKFFFAFENQNCTDYITEKFWRSLDYNLIPIVLHPKKEYFERVAPMNSFIHLEDFNYDPKSLSDYLKQVSSNLELYSKYFEWKKHYKSLYEAKALEQLRMCELCEKLNNQNNNYHSYYENLSTWFNNQCTRS